MESFVCSIVQNNEKYYINIPFNVWTKTNKKTNTQYAKVVILSDTVNVLDFECRLVPRGQEGNFYIPIGPKSYALISKYKKLSVEFDLIPQLKSINHDSPYSVDNPIRKKIEYVSQPSKGYCMHAIISMLTGESIEDVCERMQARAFQGSISKLIETLDYYGIKHGKLTYKFDSLPSVGIINTRLGRRNHYCLYYKSKFYDPTYGIKDNIPMDEIISYIEIFYEGE